MKASLKRLHSPDIDIETFWPEEEDCFGFLLEAMIGPEGENSEESFGMQVCTPAWLAKKYAAEEVVVGRHLLIVFDYDIRRIEARIRRYCERCVADSWEDISAMLGRIGNSEFEDYTAV